MKKLMTTLIAVAFASTTALTAFAQAPAKSEAPKAAAAAPAAPAAKDNMANSDAPKANSKLKSKAKAS